MPDLQKKPGNTLVTDSWNENLSQSSEVRFKSLKTAGSFYLLKWQDDERKIVKIYLLSRTRSLSKQA
jgi:hypothetical protein